jgi:cellulose synthase/poly-beta-1,6-N-acetylglucosamine synthase-like glycosyltransferase
MSAIVFWACAALVGWTYAGYPAFAFLQQRRHGRDVERADPAIDHELPDLTVVIAAYNEEARIGARVADVLAQDYPQQHLRIVVVSDGSDDATAQAAAASGDPRVRVIELARNGGKAVALDAAVATIEDGIVAFADARQRYAPGTLRRLVAPFADPSVGGVSGELAFAASDAPAAPAAALGLYWRMETALRWHEARLGTLHGVSGAIHALRRSRWVAPPPGTILDDMWIPLQVVLRGERVWIERAAIAWDRPSATGAEEFRRKLRTLAGNWQLVARLPAVASPRRNPAFFAWFSHKFLRLLVPWALLAMLASSACVGTPFWRALFALQLAAYAVAAIALLAPKAAARVPLLPTLATFVSLNTAALLSLPACLALDPRGLWKKH